MSRGTEFVAITVALAPVLAVGAVMLAWGKWDWTVIAIVGAVFVPMYFVTRNRLKFDEKFPDWRAREFERRTRGW